MKKQEIDYIKSHNFGQVLTYAIKILIIKLTSRATWLILSGLAGLFGIFLIIYKYDGRVLQGTSSGVWITGIIVFTALILAGKGSKYLSKYIELIRELRSKDNGDNDG